MPSDITHCCGQGCPLNKTCLRCTRVVMGRQNFFGACPYDFAKNACVYYWSDKPSDDKIRQLAYQLWEKSGCESGNSLAHWFDAQQQLIEQLRDL